jgi:hypothetical protein
MSGGKAAVNAQPPTAQAQHMAPLGGAVIGTAAAAAAVRAGFQQVAVHLEVSTAQHSRRAAGHTDLQQQLRQGQQ